MRLLRVMGDHVSIPNTLAWKRPRTNGASVRFFTVHILHMCPYVRLSLECLITHRTDTIPLTHVYDGVVLLHTTNLMKPHVTLGMVTLVGEVLFEMHTLMSERALTLVTRVRVNSRVHRFLVHL